MKTRFEYTYAVFVLLAVAATVFLGKSEFSTLPSIDTATLDAVAMTTTSQGLKPVLPMNSPLLETVWGKYGFNDYPFTAQYLSGLLMRLSGPSSWSGRLFGALFSILCVGLTVLLGTTLKSPLAGLLAGIVLLFTRHFIRDGLNSHLDNAMSVFILLSFIFWVKGYWKRAGIFAGLGTWIKTPVALLVVPISAIDTVIEKKFKKNFLNWIGLSSLALFTLLFFWILTALLAGDQGGTLVKDFWIRQVWGTAVGGRGQAEGIHFFQFFDILRSHYLPWSILLIASLIWAIRKKIYRERPYRICLLASGFLIGFLSLIRFKFDHYFVPAYPFLSVLSVYPIASWLEQKSQRVTNFIRAWSITGLLFVTIILCTPIQLVPESYPALKHFIPFIQTQGTCDDEILAWNTGYPYGTYLDTRDVLHFYTGRTVRLGTCEELKALTEKTKWLLGPKADLEACLSSQQLKHFASGFRYGSLVLLSSYSITEKPIDLSPLATVHQAVTDCKAPAWPKNRYQ